MPGKFNGEHTNQLCFSCKNTHYGGCPWFTDFKPVPGWVAFPTVLPSNKRSDKPGLENSYRIMRCPLYDPE